MPQRNFQNTMGYLDLLARQNYQDKQMAKQNQVEAEQRQAEYGGVQQLLKGVGAEQERIRAGDVRKAEASGIGSALDDKNAPADTGDIESDAAAQSGYQGTRLKLQTAKQSQDALLARLLAGQNDPYKQRKLEQTDERLAALEAHRQHGYDEHDEDQVRLGDNAKWSQFLRALSIMGGDNQPVYRAPPGASAPGSGGPPPSAEPNTPPPGVIRDTKTTANDAQKNLDDLLAIRPQFEQVNSNFAALQPDDFGGIAGGQVPVVGDTLKKAGIPQNRNEAMEWRRNNPKIAALAGFPDLTPEDIAGIERRAKFGGSRKDLSSIITLIRTGKVANQQELKNIDAMQGFLDSQDFGRNKDTTGKVLQQLFDIYNANVQRMQQRRKTGGLAEQGPVAGPMDGPRGQSPTGQTAPSPPANGGAGMDDAAILQLAEKIQKKNPGMSNEEALQHAMNPDDVH